MLELSNVVNISVSQNPVGLENFNVNNLALFSNEVPIANSLSSSSSSSGAGDYVPGPYGEYRIYASAAEVGVDWGTSSETYALAVAVFSQQPNILAGGGTLIIFPLAADETLEDGVTRTFDSIFYCGIISTLYPTVDADMLTLSTAVQNQVDKILFLPSNVQADITGGFTDIKDASNYNTRCLYYATSSLDARKFAASYASRALSVNFEGSNTALTMNLKALSGIVPDDSITQTIYDLAKAAGVDVYVSFAGVSSVASSGINKYFDESHNLIWFISALKVAGFNLLAQTGTKIPQTEPGISALKAAYREICEQARRNAFIAPGTWTSAEWFGNQEDFINNIQERGYYIFNTPISQQSTADRADRKSPLIQIAVKESGAVHSTDVVVHVNP